MKIKLKMLGRYATNELRQDPRFTDVRAVIHPLPIKTDAREYLLQLRKGPQRAAVPFVASGLEILHNSTDEKLHALLKSRIDVALAVARNKWVGL